MSNYARRPRRILAGVLAGAMALSVTPILGLTGVASAQEVADPTGAGNFCEAVPQSEPFTDVQTTDPAFQEIVCLVATEITTGVTATTYEPNSFVTRRQMALFLVRLANEADRLEVGDSINELPAPADTDFTDTEDEVQSIEDAISQVSQAGIAQGFPDNSYRPAAPVSRRQMAAFIDRTYEFLTGTALPRSTTDHFADDNADSAEAQASTNAVAEAGIFIGNADGTFAPADEITRRQMASVLTRTLQVLLENGEITQWAEEAEGACGVVTAVNAGAATYTFTDSSTNTSVVVTYDATSDVYTVDNAPASRNAFAAAIGVGDEVCFVDDPTAGAADADQHHLTNVAPATRNSGVIGNIDTTPDTFSIIDPVSGVAISDVKDYTGGIFFVDSAVVNEAGFEAALSEGDTITIETDAALNKTFRLVNQTVSGTVSAFDAGTDEIAIGNLGDDPKTAQDARYDYVTGATTNNYFVGGVAVTLTQFETALTTGDQLEYTRAGDVQTFRLTNVAPPAQSGVLTNVFDIGADTATLANGANDVAIDYSAINVFRVNGVAVTEAEFELALTPGDNVTLQADNPDVAGDQGSISLTNAALQGGLADVDPANDTYDVVNAQANVIYDDLDYTAAIFGGTDRYFVNGTEVTLTVFEQYLTKVAADATPDDTIQVADNNTAAGADISTDHRLTTDETLP